MTTITKPTEDLGGAAIAEALLPPTATGSPIPRSIFDLDLEEVSLHQELLMSEKVRRVQAIADPRVGCLTIKRSTDLDLERSLLQEQRL